MHRRISFGILLPACILDAMLAPCHSAWQGLFSGTSVSLRPSPSTIIEHASDMGNLWQACDPPRLRLSTARACDTGLRTFCIHLADSERSLCVGADNVSSEVKLLDQISICNSPTRPGMCCEYGACNSIFHTGTRFLDLQGLLFLDTFPLSVRDPESVSDSEEAATLTIPAQHNYSTIECEGSCVDTGGFTVFWLNLHEPNSFVARGGVFRGRLEAK